MLKNPFRWLCKSSGTIPGFEKYFFGFYSTFISLSQAFLLMMEIFSHFSIGVAFSLGSLKALSLADAIDPCSHHSQEGCQSKAFLVPASLLLPSTYPQPPKRAGCCSFTGRLHPVVQKHAVSHGNSEIQKLLVAFEQPVVIKTAEWKRRIYIALESLQCG